MTDTEYRQSIDILIYLCSCTLNKTVIDKDRLVNINLDHLYQSAGKHMLSSMTGQILRSAGITSSDFTKAIALSERKTIILEDEYKKATSEFESSQIWYMPLKGSVIQRFYPGLGLRQMADNDILFDESRAEDVKHVFEGFGYSTIHYNRGNHDVYRKEPVLNFNRAFPEVSRPRIIPKAFPKEQNHLFLRRG